jgi:nicotinic acid mononucleotide adenylyltransferase
MIVIRSAFFSLALLFAGIGSAAGAFLEDAQFRKGDRIGFYVGTFDPVHDAHIDGVRKALATGAIDHIVVLPNDFAFHKKSASAFAHRLKMLQLVFGEEPKVWVPREYSSGMLPISTTVLNRLRRKCPGCAFVGVQGTDVFAKASARFIDAVFLPGLKSWIILARDPKLVETLLASRRNRARFTVAYTSGTEISSTRIRAWIASHPEFHQTAGKERPTQLPEKIAPYVAAQGLYREDVDASAHPVFSVESFDPNEISWRSGQLVGFSARSGQTPFIVQAGTHSPIDHVGIIVVEGGSPYVYEFTNSAGVSKVSLDAAFARARGKSGHLMAIVGEPKRPLASAEWGALVRYAEDAMALQKTYGPGKIPNGPRSCTQFVNAAYAAAGRKVGSAQELEALHPDAFGGFIGQRRTKVLLDSERLLPPASVFDDGVEVIATNLPRSLEWTPTQVLRAWKDDGDLSKLARMLAIEEGRPLKENEVEGAVARLIRRLEEADALDRPGRCRSLWTSWTKRFR